MDSAENKKKYVRVDEDNPAKPFNSEKCPECGEDAVIVRDSESYFKATGYRWDVDDAWWKPFLACPKDKIFWTYRPPLWKIFLMGPFAWPKELRS